MTTATLIFYVLCAAAAVFAAALVFSADFRAKVFSFGRIKADQAYKSGTTSTQRSRDRLSELLKKFDDQEASVASLMSDADAAQRNVKTCKDSVAKFKAEYQRNKDMNADPDVLEACAKDWQDAKQALADAETAYTEADKVADDAQKDLETIARDLKAEEKNITSSEGKRKLAAAINRSTEIRKNLNSLRSDLDGFKAEHDAAQKELDDARNRAKLNQGSDTDRKRAELDEKAKGDAARAELEKELGGGAAPTTPAGN